MSELPSATRNYVVLGILLVAALAMAWREYSAVPDGRRWVEWDNALVVVGGDGGLTSERLGGFYFSKRHRSSVLREGREWLDDPNASDLSAATAFAEHNGHGFLLLDLRDDWDLPMFVEPPPGSLVAAIRIDDVSPRGPQISFGAPLTGPFQYIDIDRPHRDMPSEIAMQLALFEHPDARAASEDVSELEPRLAALQAQQRFVAEIDALWPSESLPGNLADRWERVRAAPVLGGVVVERLPIWLEVYTERGVPMAELASTEIGELAFVPNEALVAGANLVAARRPCTGLRERPMHAKRMGEHSLGVSPDGRLLVSHTGTLNDRIHIYRVVVDAPDVCKLEWVADGEPPPDQLPTPSNIGKFAPRDPEPVRDSEPGWLRDDVLVSLVEHQQDPTDAVILLLNTSGETFEWEAPRARLDAPALFPNLDRDDPATTLHAVYAVGPDTLIVLTETCPKTSPVWGHCMHRVRFRSLDSAAFAGSPFVVQTLGTIDQHQSFAISTDGTRAAFVAGPGLFSVVIQETSLAPAEFLDTNIRDDSPVRISPDGRVVVAESLVRIDKYGSLPTARAFLLAPP